MVVVAHGLCGLFCSRVGRDGGVHGKVFGKWQGPSRIERRGGGNGYLFHAICPHKLKQVKGAPGICAKVHVRVIKRVPDARARGKVYHRVRPGLLKGLSKRLHLLYVDIVEAEAFVLFEVV